MFCVERRKVHIWDVFSLLLIKLLLLIDVVFLPEIEKYAEHIREEGDNELCGKSI